MRLAALLLLIIAHAALGDLYVSGFSSGTVYHYSETTGQPIGDGIFTTGLDQPHGILRLADGTFIVANSNQHEVLRYSADGTFLNTFIENGFNGVPALTLNFPVDFTLGPDGLLYVTSQRNDRVVRFNPTTGAFVDIFIQGGALDGPSGLAFGQNGDLYVVGRFSDNLLRYDATTGTTIGGFTPTIFGEPFGIAIHPQNGELYVVDGANNSVRRIDPVDGHTISTLSGGLGFPIGIEFGPSDDLFVASFGGNRITRYNGASFAAFADVGLGSNPNFFAFAVPEPQTGVIFALASLCLLRRRRR